MKIYITGYSGFIGSSLFKELSKKNTVKKVNLRKIPILDSNNYERYLSKFNKADVIINLAASTQPKTKHDFFINQDFPKIIEKYMKNRKKKFLIIHMSTMNVLNKYILDPYTESKRVAEKKLAKSKCIILRLPLIINKTKRHYINGGQLRLFFNYLNFKFLPIYPMIYPGTKFDPVLLNDLINFISKLVTQKKIIKKIYNLSGGKDLNMWDIFEEIAKIKGKRIFKVKIKFLNIILPNYFKKLLQKRSTFIKHLLMFDNTNLTPKRTILR